MRVGCCARVYHVAVIKTNEGSAAASNAPEKNRRMAMSVKLLLPAWAMRRTPHRKIYETLGRVEMCGRLEWTNIECQILVEGELLHEVICWECPCKPADCRKMSAA